MFKACYKNPICDGLISSSSHMSISNLVVFFKSIGSGDDDEEDAAPRGAVGGGGRGGQLKSNIVGYPESDDDDNSNVREEGAPGMPTELMELKRQLNFLRNEFTAQVSGAAV